MLSFGFRIFCWYRGFCHRTGSDLLLFLVTYSELIPCLGKRFARKNMTAVSSGILLFMSALTICTNNYPDTATTQTGSQNGEAMKRLHTSIVYVNLKYPGYMQLYLL